MIPGEFVTGQEGRGRVVETFPFPFRIGDSGGGKTGGEGEGRKKLAKPGVEGERGRMKRNEEG